MLIYNVTTKVSWLKYEAWLQWMIEEHMPEVLQTGLIFRYQLVKLLEVDDIDGPTFAVQYYIDSKENYDDYVDRFAPELRERALTKWGDHVISFRTLMEVIN